MDWEWEDFLRGGILGGLGGVESSREVQMPTATGDGVKPVGQNSVGQPLGGSVMAKVSPVVWVGAGLVVLLLIALIVFRGK